MKKIVDYFKDVYNELVNKTSWPTWRDLSNSAIVVMIASVIIACMVFVMDFTFEHVLKLVYGVMYH
ncbi:MAG: preprotein translocase subunit SecE [Bacteroidales bacterium]|nr:preprotein translocase subunit SecE [Bacteroidales bacterium]